MLIDGGYIHHLCLFLYIVFHTTLIALLLTLRFPPLCDQSLWKELFLLPSTRPDTGLALSSGARPLSTQVREKGCTES